MGIRRFIKHVLREFIEYHDLIDTDLFDKFELTTMTQVDDEVQIMIEDNFIEAHISYNNDGYRDWIYLARIDALEKGNGYGSAFLGKLKTWGKKNGFLGIFLWMEEEQLIPFYRKNGFERGDDGYMFFHF